MKEKASLEDLSVLKKLTVRVIPRWLRKRASLLRYKALALIKGKIIVHFLHVGKTGGTSIIAALDNRNRPYWGSKYAIFAHHHVFTLKHVPPQEKCFFFVRDPVDRFVSGFNGRKREDFPAYNARWTPQEEEAFSQFETPDELARALSDEDEVIREKAVRAMRSIIHVRSSYWDWFINEAYFLSRLNDIIFVGSQKTLTEDFERLKSVLDLPSTLTLLTGETQTNRNPETMDKHLSSEAKINLKRWYEREYQFLEMLKENNLIERW